MHDIKDLNHSNTTIYIVNSALSSHHDLVTLYDRRTARTSVFRYIDGYELWDMANRTIGIVRSEKASLAFTLLN